MYSAPSRQGRPDTTPAVAISVIVPVYNIAAWLPDSIASLLNQHNPPSYEIILVDDGSTDGSQTICDALQSSCPERIRLFRHAQNQGLSVARNTGLAQVRGEYFTFLDGDDLLPPDALKELYTAAKRHSADIVKGNNTIFDEQGSHPAKYNCKRKNILYGDKILSAFYEHRHMRGHTWGKLFRTELLASVQNQPGVTMAQDTLYCAELFAKAHKLVLIPKTVYEYRLRSGSTTHRKFETGAYLWWLYSIENAGQFARTRQQRCCHKQLQLRTLLQLSKEARKLPQPHLQKTLDEIRCRQSQWELQHIRQLLQQRVKLRWLVHFIQLRRILARMEHTQRKQTQAAHPEHRH